MVIQNRMQAGTIYDIIYVLLLSCLRSGPPTVREQKREGGNVTFIRTEQKKGKYEGVGRDGRITPAERVEKGGKE